MSTDPIDVFISSTCYDLIDLRSVLHAHLKARQFVVRLSDAADSDFQVSGDVDSIASCLSNVAASSAVVCVVDGRYGPKLPARYGGISATHAEVRKAKELNKPVFTFVRDRAWNEYQEKLKADPSTQTKWVEPRSAQSRAARATFMEELSKLSHHGPGSNWCDVFRDVTELAPVMVKRLIDKFPEYAGALAMQPDRLVRMTFVYAGRSDPQGLVGGFRNIGVGPALNVKTGTCAGARLNASDSVFDNTVSISGGVPECEFVPRPGNPQLSLYEMKNGNNKAFCEYENRFGDRYRIELMAHMPNANGFCPDGPEVWYVRQGDEKSRKWFPVPQT